MLDDADSSRRLHAAGRPRAAILVRQLFDHRHARVRRRACRYTVPASSAASFTTSRKVNDLREAMVATGLFDSGGGRAAAYRRNGAGRHGICRSAGHPECRARRGGWRRPRAIRPGKASVWTAAGRTRNLFRPEGSLIVTGVAGTQEQGLTGAFRRSNAGRRDRTVLLSLAANRQDYDAYKALTAGINGRI